MLKIAAKKWIGEQLCVRMARTCNLYCVYCQDPPRGARVSPAKTIAEVKSRGIRAVSLEGAGEPTANKDFFLWIKALRGAGVTDFMLSTNGVNLSDPDFSRKAEKAINYFTVNFPGHTEVLYKKATRSVKFSLALKGLKNLKELGAENKVRFFHVIFGGNYRSLPDFSAWVAENHPAAAFVNFTFVRNRGRVADSAEIVPEYSKTAPFLKLALARLKRKGIKAVAQNVPLCVLKDFEGFSFEFQRWFRGDRVLEAGVARKAGHPACRRCRLEPACCGARADYIKVHGAGELTASAKDPAAIKPEKF